MIKVWTAAAAAVLALALLAACGGDGRPPAGNEGIGDTVGGSRTAEALAGSTASGAGAGGRKLSDCEYATALVRSLERFTAALPTFGTARPGNKDAVIRAFDTFDGELAALVGELKGYRLSAEVALVNSGVIAVFEDARAQLPELTSAVERGDVAKLTEVASRLRSEVFPRLDAIQTGNKAAMNRLNSCVKA